MRPRFHFTAERGWINDPHGIAWHDGRYHAFYQYVPDSMTWGPNCHWGHAVGDDLVSLHPRAVALAPGDGDDGIWTGSLAETADGDARIFYTSTVGPHLDRGRIRVATPDDSAWERWTKRPGILLEAPTNLDVIAYRDPFVFRDGDAWRMFVGAGLRGGIAAALAYISADLETWTYTGIAAHRSAAEVAPVWMGSLWECPQLVEIDGRHVLITSVWDEGDLHYAGYAVGAYAKGRFIAQTWGRLSYGRSYYAPSLFRDRDGRPCLSFWMRGVRGDDEGWSSAHSVPHLLSLDGDRLIAEPHPDLDRYLDSVLPGDGHIPGHAVDVRWLPSSADQLTVRVDGVQTLRVDAIDGQLVMFGGQDPAVLPFSGGGIRLVLDGPAAELSTGDGILGMPMSAPEGRLTVSTRLAPPEIRPLQREG